MRRVRWPVFNRLPEETTEEPADENTEERRIRIAHCRRILPETTEDRQMKYGRAGG